MLWRVDGEQPEHAALAHQRANAVGLVERLEGGWPLVRLTLRWDADELDAAGDFRAGQEKRDLAQEYTVGLAQLADTRRALALATSVEEVTSLRRTLLRRLWA